MVVQRFICNQTNRVCLWLYADVSVSGATISVYSFNFSCEANHISLAVRRPPGPNRRNHSVCLRTEAVRSVTSARFPKLSEATHTARMMEAFAPCVRSGIDYLGKRDFEQQIERKRSRFDFSVRLRILKNNFSLHWSTMDYSASNDILKWQVTKARTVITP